MPLTCNDIMTLHTAVRAFDLDGRTLRLLRKRLQGKELVQLGWQEDRGYYYRTAHIVEALEGIEIRSPRTVPHRTKAVPGLSTRVPEGHCTVQEAAYRLGVPKRDVMDLVNRGRLHILRESIGRARRVFITQASIHAELERREALASGDYREKAA